jgi:putative ABC transport system substrate-binding protein
VKRREFITLLGGAAVTGPLAARAQQSERMRRIGWLGTISERDLLGQVQVNTFRQEMARLGWREGDNLLLDYRGTAGDDNRARVLATELIGYAPDVLVPTGTQVTAALQKLTRSIPIVFVNVADPIASHFVSSYAQPGGNITGFTAWEYSIAGKWLEVLREIAPETQHVTVLINPNNPTWAGHWQTIEALASSIQTQVTAIRVVYNVEIERAVQSAAHQPRGGLIVLPSGLMSANRELIAGLALRHSLPAIYPYSYFTSSGGLISYGTDALDLYRRAAVYVDRIFKGEKPADLPVQAPTKYELVINLKTAKALGLEVPPTLLARADEVIE